MLTFAYPWFALLLPLPLAGLALRAALCAEPARACACRSSPALVALTGLQPRPRHRRQPAAACGARSLLALAWLLTLAALMRPQWIEPPLHQDKPARDLLLLVDLSGSMDTKDFTDPRRQAGRPPDRREAGARRLPRQAQGRPGRRRRVRRCALQPGAVHHRPRSSAASSCRRCRSAWPARAPRWATPSASASTCSPRSTVPAQTIIALTDGNDTASKVPPADAAGWRATTGSSSTPSRSAIPRRRARTSSTRRR